MKQLQSQAGMTLIEVMIAIAISSIVILASISIGNMSTNIQAQNNVSFQADIIRRNLVALILSDAAWDQTKANNSTSFSCLPVGPCSTTPGYQINTIYDSGGHAVYFVGALQGFNNDGTKCTGTATNPCPLTFKVQWTPVCAGASCVPTQMKVDIIAGYNNPTAVPGKQQMVFNEANYSATLYR